MDRAWPADYWERERRLRRFGLLARLSVEYLPDGGDNPLLAVVVQPLPGEPVLNDERPWPLHFSLCFKSEVRRPRDLETLRRRWGGRLVRLRFSWTGSGGTGFLACRDVLRRDRLVRRLHKQGWYEKRGLHCSV